MNTNPDNTDNPSPDEFEGLSDLSRVTLDDRHENLYAVGEIDDFGGQKAGGVSAYRIDQDTRRLTLLNQTPSGGRGPCHLVVDHKGGHVLVANYGGGSCAAIDISADE